MRAEGAFNHNADCTYSPVPEQFRSCQEHVGETEFFLQNSVSQSPFALSFDMSQQCTIGAASGETYDKLERECK